MLPICSADGHLIEPHDLWQTRLPKSLRPHALRSEHADGVRRWYNHEGKLYLTGDHFQTRPGQEPIDADPERRLKDIDSDGIWAETIFPNIGLQVLTISDAELALACARAYNDYIIEAYGPYRQRLVTVPLLPIVDIDGAVKELERVANAGLRGALIPLVPPYPYYRLDIYEPLWAAAQAHGMPLAFHVGTGFVKMPDGTAVPYSRAGLHMGQAASTGFTGVRRLADEDDDRTGDAMRTIDAVRIGREPQEAIAALVGSGTLEKFPDLHFISVENNANWLGFCMAAMDKAWTIGIGQPDSFLATFHDCVSDPATEKATDIFGHRWRYPLKPSEYIRRQVHATFMDDPGAVAFRHFTGIEPLLWGADYPHPEGTWPETQAAVATLFQGVPEDEKRAMLGGTLAKLYGITLPDAA